MSPSTFNHVESFKPPFFVGPSFPVKQEDDVISDENFVTESHWARQFLE
eukprot:CAMPEP_0115041876 /NCGR_PEP_ID=MMETSP0216-20121206/45924_1 /TAXON_ID=223996 /ORGANISM="Protocruzia adherens, Strain Boccale" /LENGTH=48 /DNA_ID= /DNA_START= /DNA_END= /DNA_ORIENTATION=